MSNDWFFTNLLVLVVLIDLSGLYPLVAREVQNCLVDQTAQLDLKQHNTFYILCCRQMSVLNKHNYA